MTQSTCPSCGQTVADRALFCDRCGHALSSISADPPPLPQQPEPTESSQQPVSPLFPVATRKFIAMSLCTFGLYELYWCYQNWKRLRIASSEDLSPFWRACFAPLWGFSLFRRIRGTAAAAGVPITWDSNLLATIYLLFAIIPMHLPEPWWLIRLLSFVAFIPVQRTAQRVNALQAGTSTHWRNDTYSRANVVIMVIGATYTILCVLGMFLPR